MMAANLGLMLVAVVSLFGLFMAALAYGAWMTRGMKMTNSH